MRTIKKMTKSKYIRIVCGVVVMLFASSCSKSNPLNPIGNCFGGNWAETYVGEFEAWSNAANAYSENPTAANCANYKSAANSYIDAVEDIYDCIPTGDRAEFDQELKDAKADIAKEDCD